MKARVIWTLIAVVLVGLTAMRIHAVKSAAAAPQEERSEAALVKTAHVTRGDLAEKVSMTGTVKARNEVDVFAKVGGRIDSLPVQVGDKVKAGQVLATIEHKEISWQAKAAQAQLQVARAQYDGAKLEFDRTQAMFKGGAVPVAQMDGAKVKLALAEAQVAAAEAQAGSAQQQVENATVVSPIAGTIIRRPVNLGAQVGPQTAMFTVQDVAALKMETAVDAATFARLQKGAAVEVAVDALPDQTFPGKVTLLSPALDAQTRRAAVELEVDNASGKLLPNMFGHADVAVGNLAAALVIPKEALFEAAGGTRVFKIKDGKAQAVKPKLGPADDKKIVVLEGLSEGDEVATSGQANLADGTPVKSAPAGAPVGALTASDPAEAR